MTDLTAVISKIDRVDAARLEAARTAVRDVLDRAGYAAAPVLQASSVTGDGIPAVRATIEAKAAAYRARDASGGFRLAIDRSFSPAGAGLVVTGTAASGVVSVGDRLLLSPSRLAARVRGIQVHNEVDHDSARGRPLRAGDLRTARRAGQAETRRLADRSVAARTHAAHRRAGARRR